MRNLIYVLWFVLLVLLQVLIFNHILFWGYLNPYLYIFFILMLPPNIDKALLLITAFALGASIDLFENSGGVHAAATTTVAFMRSFLLKIGSSRQSSELQDLRLSELSFRGFMVYGALVVFVHHLLLFTIEAFSFQSFGTTILRTALSSLFTFALVVVIYFWNYRKVRT